MKLLVIGSGIAGLSFALRVASFADVAVVTKKRLADTATNLAQGGIAAVLDLENDSNAAHIEDTLVAGAGLCDYEVVTEVVENGSDRIQDLLSYGVEFVEDSPGKGLSLGKEGGHSQRRVAHAYDLTGRAIEQTLLERVKSIDNISLFEDHTVVDLIVDESDNGRLCRGGFILDPEGEIVRFDADQTILCTGGAGKVYLYTSNPDIATGDGVAAAARAGAAIANMEFVQFHPTCLYHPQAKNFLISEAVRGEGALLFNHRGERFMERYDPRLELATRDMVARSIDHEMKEKGDDYVFLDISHKNAAFVRTRFPGIYRQCMEYGIDITVEPIPVVPAAHYLCGGVMVDGWANTTLDGLMAVGETACTGLHGANRLASNSLLEAVVFAEKAARYCADNVQMIMSRGEGRGAASDHEQAGVELGENVLISHNWDVLRRTMWNYVGIVRNSTRLELARQRVTAITREIESMYSAHRFSRDMVELRNIALVSLMIIEAAMQRKESRGLHYTTDFPETLEAQRTWTLLTNRKEKEYWEFVVERHEFSLAP